MNGFVLAPLAAMFLTSVIGCAVGTYNTTTVPMREVASGEYCHKKLRPIGPSDLARTNQIGSDDYIIDYYGPCDGPSLSEQIQQQKRYESFRIGREYMDEG